MKSPPLGPSSAAETEEQGSYVVVDMEICDDVDTQVCVDSSVCTRYIAENGGEGSESATNSCIASNNTIKISPIHSELKFDANNFTENHILECRDTDVVLPSIKVAPSIDLAPIIDPSIAVVEKLTTNSSHMSIKAGPMMDQSHTLLEKHSTKSPHEPSFVVKVSSIPVAFIVCFVLYML